MDVDERAGAARGQGEEAEFRAAEHLEIIDIARAVYAGRAHARPVEAARLDQLFRFRLRCAVGRQARLACSEGGNEDEALYLLGLGGLDQADGSFDIRLAESSGVGGVGEACHVDDGVGAVAKCFQRSGVGQAALDPLHPCRFVLRTAGQRPNCDFSVASDVEHCPADKAGGPCQRDNHARTMWSRWTTAARGA